VGIDLEETRRQLEAAVERQREEAAAILAAAEREERGAAERYTRVRRAFQDGKITAEDWAEQREELIEERDAAAAKLAQVRANDKAVEASAEQSVEPAQTPTSRYRASSSEPTSVFTNRRYRRPDMPSRTRYGGSPPSSVALDSAGALTRDFSDALMLYSGMRDAPLAAVASDKPSELHIAVNAFGRDQVSEAQLARYEVLFDALRKAGASFAQVSHAHSPRQSDLMRCEFKHDLEGYLLSSSAPIKTLDKIVNDYESNPKRMMKYGITLLRGALLDASGKLDDAPYLKALSERERQRAQIVQDLRGYDACVMTGPTNIMHFTGLPSVALRLCMADDHTPRGIILYGADEIRLYAAARTIEKHCLQVTFPRL
jgi:hypothetical protein